MIVMGATKTAQTKVGRRTVRTHDTKALVATQNQTFPALESLA